MTVATDLGPAVAALEPIGLAELTARASLQTRVDRKYVLPLREAHELVAALGWDGRVLEIDGMRSFGYESVYFDTPELTCYLLAARRRPARFKVRTRTYLDSSTSWLEVKTRDRRGRTVKHRDPVEDTSALTGDGREFVRSVLRREGLGVPDAPLAPRLVTRYQRTTLYLPGSASRLTIDTDLVCSDRSGDVRLTGHAVVETKAAAHASPADRLLWSGGRRPVQISKYGTALAALEPDLPSVRWRPVLRRALLTRVERTSASTDGAMR